MIASVPVDVRSLLAWTNHRIVELRLAIRHRHDDSAWWDALRMTPGYAQAGRAILRRVAHLLHVERANARARIHGNFESLEQQREWLARWEVWKCSTAASYLGVQMNATLVALRAGEVVQEREVEPERDDVHEQACQVIHAVEGMEARVDEVQS